MSQIVLAVRDPVSASTRTFDQDTVLVGRAEESDIVLADRAASRRHARLVREGERLVDRRPGLARRYAAQCEHLDRARGALAW